MSEINWPRAHWQDSGESAFILWFVFGEFEPDFSIDAPRYRTRGTPGGVDVVRYLNSELEKWDGYPLSGTLGRLLWEENAHLFERAQKARECVMLRGSLTDPADLDYLRDLIGTITALTDLGGVAIIDPQTLSMFSADEWRRRYFERDSFSARAHVLILCNEDERHAGRLHVHTRGLRKFARPDISVRNVPPAAASSAGELAERFVEFQAAGGRVAEDHAIELDGVPEGMQVRIAGASEDPEFNNRHLDLCWPD